MSRSSNLIAVAIFLVLVAVVLSLSPRTRERIQGATLSMISPFLSTGSTLQKQVSSVTQRLKTLQELEKENEQLKITNRKLSAESQLLQGLSDENKQLHEALEYRKRSVFQLIPARVIARDASSWWSTVEINRGEENGMEIDMPVLTEDGLVGKVISTSPKTARVVLISDESCKIAASVEGTSERGIVSGEVRGERVGNKAEPLLNLNIRSKQAVVQSGQKVYSSGAGGVFPSGVLVGTVKEFAVRSLDGQAKLIPAVDLASIEDVFVVYDEEKPKEAAAK
jgi:rod shape-determining protein MreC